MNISTKCNCCIKEDVCKYKADYIRNKDNIIGAIDNEDIVEVSVKCKKFNAGQAIR